jgi:drug/metabolite transporter (DMT)-like permease
LPEKTHQVRGYLLIAGAALCYGASAALGKAAFRGIVGQQGATASLDPLILAQARSTISFLILATILFATRREPLKRFATKDVLRCMLIGILGLAGSNFFYYYSIQKTTVATAIIVQYTAPVWVLLYMAMRGLQTANRRKVLSVIFAIVGCAMAIGLLRVTATSPFVNVSGFKGNPAGIGAALIAAFTFSFYSIYGQIQVRRYDRWYVVLFAMFGAAVLWMIVNPPWKVIAAHYTKDLWLFLLVFALVSMLLPLSLYFAGLQYIDATRAVITSCLEPVFAILFAAAFVGETLGVMQIVGIICVLAATVMVQAPEKDMLAPSEIAPVD